MITYARRQRVDSNSMMADFLRHGSAQLVHGGFACVVGATGQSLDAGLVETGVAGTVGCKLTLLAMLPDMDAMRTMLPWILFATMSFATAFAVMKDPGYNVSGNSDYLMG